MCQIKISIIHVSTKLISSFRVQDLIYVLIGIYWNLYCLIAIFSRFQISYRFVLIYSDCLKTSYVFCTKYLFCLQNFKHLLFCLQISRKSKQHHCFFSIFLSWSTGNDFHKEHSVLFMFWCWVLQQTITVCFSHCLGSLFVWNVLFAQFMEGVIRVYNITVLDNFFRVSPPKCILVFSLFWKRVESPCEAICGSPVNN